MNLIDISFFFRFFFNRRRVKLRSFRIVCIQVKRNRNKGEGNTGVTLTGSKITLQGNTNACK